MDYSVVPQPSSPLWEGRNLLRPHGRARPPDAPHTGTTRILRVAAAQGLQSLRHRLSTGPLSPRGSQLVATVGRVALPRDRTISSLCKTERISSLCAPEFKIARNALRRRPLGWSQTEKRTRGGERKRKRKMKKLMFAAAVTAGLVAFGDGIESANTVGYGQSDLRNGATMVTPQFAPMSGNTISLDSLVPTGENLPDNIDIRVLDSYGRTVDGCAYAWNDWVADEPCWATEDFEKAEGITFAPGQGLWVYGKTTSQGLRSAGQVGIADVIVTLRNGGTPTGNPFPVAIDLDDILPEGENLPDNIDIRVLDAYGRTVDGCAYAWNDWVADTPCWATEDFEKAEGITFAPGQGLWVYGKSTSQTLRFPAPEL